MILLSDETRQCSGAIINNVEEDLTPYLLTAFHCIDTNDNGVISSSEEEDAEQWIIMYNDESPNCSNTDGPTNQTVSGTSLKANNSASDFALLRLSTTPPRSYDVRYAGWSRSTTAPNSSVGIPHPRGDIKKISFEDDTANSYTWPGTPTDSHWEVVWEDGTTERGSSGSSLFDPNYRIVGQLHGGLASCDDPDSSDYFGKFSMSWNQGGNSSTRLRDWLDPNNTGATTLDGMDDPRPYPPTNVYISGNVGGLPTVNWTASPNTISNYRVYRKGFYTSTSWSLIGTTTNTYWTDSQITIELPGGATDYYTYKVTAMGTNGWESESSNQPGTYGKPWCPPPCKTGSENAEVAVPETYTLYQNYPNPFNPQTVIHFDLPEAGHVSLVVYDISGREIVHLVDGKKEAGHHHISWDARDLPSGVYLYTLTTKGFTQTRRMILVK